MDACLKSVVVLVPGRGAEEVEADVNKYSNFVAQLVGGVGTFVGCDKSGDGMHVTSLASRDAQSRADPSLLNEHPLPGNSDPRVFGTVVLVRTSFSEEEQEVDVEDYRLDEYLRFLSCDRDRVTTPQF